jgi:hypothetical protein
MASIGEAGMSNVPDWLPEALRYSDFKGDWDRFLARVYEIFEHAFKKNRPRYEGFPIDYDSRIEEGKEVAFWHVTSSIDSVTKERVPDLRRCERIPWPRPMIEHSPDEHLSVWKNKRGAKTRILLWLEKLDYLVVLQQGPNTVILVTAYCTDRDHTRRKLRKEREIGLK